MDLGAQWLEFSVGNPITTLCAEHNIQHSYAPDDIRLYTQHGKRIRTKYLQRLIQTVDLIIEECSAEGFARMDSEHLSLFRFVTDAQREPHHGAARLFQKGYAQLPITLSESLDIRMNQIVQHISYAGAGATVTTDRDVFHGDQVVVTVPIGVLKQNRIRFEPPLPAAKEKVINTFGVGAAHKILIRFDKVFWPHNRLYFGWISEQPNRFPLWVNVYAYTGAPVLALWSHGEAAQQLEQLPAAEQLAYALDSLEQVFGDKLPAVTASAVSSWQKDAFTLGAYSYLPVGAPEGMYITLAEPVGDTVFFAGEATASDSPATVHGAYKSGVDAAQMLLSSISYCR